MKIPSDDVAKSCREKPAEIIPKLETARHDCCDDLSAAGDAMREVSSAPNKCEHPGRDGRNSERFTGFPEQNGD